ncbi:MAG TPA: class I SAM-dependent methyltransferase [Candidatus Binatia bacterium]|jgi:ubiquinone/menaquinone biosynthesis C-methylase UbiE|nr:class I SAM-dependent methyltransferase [Candidatus Binatia bacterium]
MPKDPTSWGDVADWYDRMLGEGDTFQAKVILPNLTRLLAVKPGVRLLEIACGQGYFSHAFAAQGAEVTGADVAPELIALAQKKSPKAKSVKTPRFLVAPSHDVAPVAAGSVDMALIVLALQNIDDVRGTFQECARALAARGSLHAVLNHPAFRVPQGSGWEWDKDGRQYRRVDRYMTEAKVKIKMRPGADPKAETISFHRPLQFFVKALAKQGFAVTNLEEWTSHKTSDSGPRAKEENRARKEIPMFLYLEAKKI